MHIFRDDARGYLISLAGVGVAALISDKLDELLNTLNISLLYLFVVLIAATSYGYGPAIMASVLGVLFFYFQFYPPYGLNSDLQPEDWLTLGFFLTFAITISRLASAARARAEEARKRASEAQARERELTTLQRLDEAMQAGDDLPVLLSGLVTQVRSTFGLQGCAILLPDECGTLQERAASRTGMEPTGEPVAVSLQFTNMPEGILQLERSPLSELLTDGDWRVLTTFATQAALAIERAMFATEARDAAVLREGDRLKTSLLRLISHDLCTPLATIKARTSSALEGDVGIEPAEWQESMRAIDMEANRLERLLAKALDLSRIEAGAVQPQLEPYTADEIVSAVLPHLEESAKQHNLVVDVPDDLPPICVDIVLIGQVLANLLENAFKYAPAGSTVRLEAKTRAGGLLLEVADEGPGIPSHLRERVFDAFYRMDRPSESGMRGAGLGLAICRSLVDAHSGWIQAVETPGGGATFRVWLPVQPAEAPVSADRTAAPTAGSARSGTDG